MLVITGEIASTYTIVCGSNTLLQEPRAWPAQRRTRAANLPLPIPRSSRPPYVQTGDSHRVGISGSGARTQAQNHRTACARCRNEPVWQSRPQPVCQTIVVAYHESFWLAVAAAAPVIGLANTVSITDVTGVWFSEKRGRRSRGVKVGYFFIVLLSIINFFLQAVALAMALKSFLVERDYGSAVLAGICTAGGFVYVLVIVLYSMFIRYMISQSETETAANKPVSDKKNHKSPSGLGWPNPPKSSVLRLRSLLAIWAARSCIRAIVNDRFRCRRLATISPHTLRT